jgi:SAM-dependent methyltransferase
MTGFVSAVGSWVLAAAVVLSPTAVVAEPEPSWKVFDERLDRTAPAVADAMLKLANVTANDVVYDLGSGDGVIVVTAAQRYGANAFGIDINPEMVARARANAEKASVADKATFAEGDLYKVDLMPATVITLFLWPTMNMKLRPRLLELEPGVRIVSHEHGMGGWQPDRIVRVSDGAWGRQPLFLWIVPARIGGSWQLSVDDGSELGVEFKQSFQRFGGLAKANGRTHRLRNGRVEGTRVTFDLAMANGETKHYSGVVTADGMIEGSGWRAKRKT